MSLGASCTISGPNPSGGVLGPSLAENLSKTDQHFGPYFSFRMRLPISMGLLGGDPCPSLPASGLHCGACILRVPWRTRQILMPSRTMYRTLRYAVLPPVLESGLRAGFRLDSNRGSFKIGPPPGLRPAERLILKLNRLKSGRHPGRPNSVPEALSLKIW